MRRASGSVIPLRSSSSSIPALLHDTPTYWPQYTVPGFLRRYVEVAVDGCAGEFSERRYLQVVDAHNQHVKVMGIVAIGLPVLPSN